VKNRLVPKLRAMRAERRRGVLPFVTAGDGGLDTTLAVLRALERAGAAAVELGLPFSDPIADGPVLQAAAGRALESGTRFAGILDVIARFRSASDLPLVVLSYANPLLVRGLDRTCRQLAEAGADGLLAVDIPVEEGVGLAESANAHGLCPIFFASPTSDEARIRAAASHSRGFLYAIGRLGVTGARTELDADTLAFLSRVRSCSAELPIAVGFGIGTPEQVRAATASADLAIVGTALVECVHRSASAAPAGEPGSESAAPSARAVRAARAAYEFLLPLTEALTP
jgi:tryptophan synthase alpha chain